MSSSLSSSRPLSVKDRVELLSRWFEEWNPCEQTLALYSLLRRVTATQARFLSFVLSQKIATEAQDIEQLEFDANSSSYLKSLYLESEEEALDQLLAHLPLLHPVNSEAKEEYLTFLPKVILSFSEDLNYMDQCKQLLSLSLVHPAFDQDDRAKLSYWMTRLHDKPDRKPTSHSPTLDKPPCPLPQVGPARSCGDHSTLDSVSGYEDCNYENGDYVEEEDYMTVSEFLNEKGGIPNTYPLPHGALSPDQIPPPIPQKSYSLPKATPSPATSLVNLHKEDSALKFKPGLKDIPIWLKSLRLHKYQYIFENLTYDEMMNLTDDQLSQMDVTQGARNKILQNIKKLSQHSQTLLELEKEVGRPGRQTLSSIIIELRQMLITPMKPTQMLDELLDNAANTMSSQSSSDTAPPSCDDCEGSPSSSTSSSPVNSPKTPPLDYNLSMSSSDHSSSDSMSRDSPVDDIPVLITRIMTKVYSQLMLPGGADNECYKGFLQLLEHGMCHEAFHVEQRKLFFSWKQSCLRNFKVVSPHKKPSNGKKWNGVGSTGSYPGQTAVSRPVYKQARSVAGTRPKGLNTPTLSPTSLSARSTPIPPNISRLPTRHMLQTQQYPSLNRANSIPYSLNQVHRTSDMLSQDHNSDGYQIYAAAKNDLYMDNMDHLSKQMTEQLVSDDSQPEPSF